MTRLKRWFRDLPIERKLSVITTCVVLAALLPITAAALSYEYRAALRAEMLGTQVQASIIRDNTAAALAFRDQSSATEVLDTLRASSTIVQAVLTLPDGGVFAHYVRKGAKLSPEPDQLKNDQEVVTSRSILVSRNVYLKNQAVGSLMMETNLDELHDRIRFYALFMAFGTLAALGFAHWLARRLITSITRPLSRLVKLTHEVASNED